MPNLANKYEDIVMSEQHHCQLAGGGGILCCHVHSLFKMSFTQVQASPYLHSATGGYCEYSLWQKLV